MNTTVGTEVHLLMRHKALNARAAGPDSADRLFGFHADDDLSGRIGGSALPVEERETVHRREKVGILSA